MAVGCGVVVGKIAVEGLLAGVGRKTIGGYNKKGNFSSSFVKRFKKYGGGFGKKPS